MYDFVRGAVVSRAAGHIVLDAGGVGYSFSVSTSTLQRTPADGEATLYAHLLLRDDRAELYGFSDRSERHLFRQLLGVAGVGPAAGLALLSAHSPESLATHIACGEVAQLTRAKGIGKRTAERILVELRDRLAAAAQARPAGDVPRGREDAVLALCSLGLQRSEAVRRVAAVPEGELATEEIVRLALRPG